MGRTTIFSVVSKKEDGKAFKEIIHMMAHEPVVRERLIYEAYLTGMSLDEVDKYLDDSGFGKLYVRNRRDAVWKYVFMRDGGADLIKEYISSDSE